MIRATHTNGAKPALLSRQKEYLCCRMYCSATLPKMMVMYWNQPHSNSGLQQELAQLSHFWICNSSSTTALHCTGQTDPETNARAMQRKGRGLLYFSGETEACYLHQQCVVQLCHNSCPAQSNTFSPVLPAFNLLDFSILHEL